MPTFVGGAEDRHGAGGFPLPRGSGGHSKLTVTAATGDQLVIVLILGLGNT